MDKKYEKLSKEELLGIIEKLERRKKFGLIWDAEKVPEKVVQNCSKHLPVLKEVSDNEIKDKFSDINNILIEGDNFHSLSTLNYTHYESIDVIYIDPPYNTSNGEFLYNDKRIDKNDSFKHSKWLNFMEKRLKLAKNLLKISGVIYISIAKEEFAQLKILCDEIFGEDNFIENIIWRKKEGGGQQDDYYVTEHEYILMYAKRKGSFQLIEKISKKETKYKYFDKKKQKWYNIVKLAKWGSSALKEDRPTMHFPITAPDGNDYLPLAPDGRLGRWRYGKLNVERLIDEESIEWVKKGNSWLPYERCYDEGPAQQILKQRSIFYDYGTTADGTKELTDIFGLKDIFPNPKPTELIQEILIQSCPNDGIILDFFAGSGTTAHAVLKLNKLDNGKRKFILCTNNEENICSKITYPRIKKIINGYTNKKKEKRLPLGSNLKYFKTDFVKNSINKDQLKIDLTKKCSEMLCLKEDIFNLHKEAEDYKIFSEKNKTVAIYFNFISESLFDLIEDLKRINNFKKLYCFTLDPRGLDESLFDEVKDLEIEAIPHKMLEIYKQIFN